MKLIHLYQIATKKNLIIKEEMMMLIPSSLLRKKWRLIILGSCSINKRTTKVSKEKVQSLRPNKVQMPKSKVMIICFFIWKKLFIMNTFPQVNQSLFLQALQSLLQYQKKKKKNTLPLWSHVADELLVIQICMREVMSSTPCPDPYTNWIFVVFLRPST